MGSPNNPLTETFLYPYDLSICYWEEKLCFDTHGSPRVNGITRAHVSSTASKIFFQFLVPCYSRQFTFAGSLTVRQLDKRKLMKKNYIMHTVRFLKSRADHKIYIWFGFSPLLLLSHIQEKIRDINITFTRNENISYFMKEQAYQQKVTHFLSIFTRSSFPLL